MKSLKALFIALSLTITAPVFALDVNINADDAATIAEGMSGIGLKKAEAIVEYRKQNGEFKSLDDLLNVPGIGEKTLQKNRDNIKLSQK